MTAPGRSSGAVTEERTGADFVLTRDWTDLAQSPKHARLLQRRAKILRHVETYGRQVRVLDRLLGDAVRKHEPVLEVACGMGFYLLDLSALGWTRIVGMEIDPHLSVLTQSAARRFALPLKVLVGDACAIPVADGTCAAVLSHSFFEHVYDVDLALREQVRVLKPGGRLLVFDGNLLNPKTVFDLLVLYPIRTRGRRGGLRWAMHKRKIYENLYGYLPRGRDEDIRTPRWWRKRIGREPGLKVIWAGTGGHFTHPHLPSWARTFIGSCVVVAEKT